MSIVRQSLKWLLTACLPEERWLARGRYARGGVGPAISLTFDDGPHPEFTPQVLDRLQTFGWKGTFFVVGEKAQQYPELVRRIVQEGHELGTHSWTHSEPGKTSAAKLIDETSACKKLLTEICGQTTPLMRPPKGELTWRKIAGLWRKRETIVLWNIDPKDYRPQAGLDLRRWAACYSPQHGDIVLLHDGTEQASGLLDQLQEHRRLIGVETVSISTWLPARAQQLTENDRSSLSHRESEGLRCP